jgi:hypothetical protein
MKNSERDDNITADGTLKMDRAAYESYMTQGWSDEDVAQLLNNDRRKMEIFQGLPPHLMEMKVHFTVYGRYPWDNAKLVWQPVYGDVSSHLLKIPANSYIRIIEYYGSVQVGGGLPSYGPEGDPNPNGQAASNSFLMPSANRYCLCAKVGQQFLINRAVLAHGASINTPGSPDFGNPYPQAEEFMVGVNDDDQTDNDTRLNWGAAVVFGSRKAFAATHQNLFSLRSE